MRIASAILLLACEGATVPDDAGACVPLIYTDTLEDERASCAFGPGASPRETLGTIDRADIPIDHLVIVMQENRAFDHYFGTFDGANVFPPAYTNPDTSGAPVSPFHLDSTCLPDDPPHQWDAMHAQWNGGAMDGFVVTAATTGDGHYALGYYDETDLPFYHWLARTYAFSDAHFASALGGTWTNRNFLYTGSSYGVRNTGERTIPEAITIFDQLDGAGVSWGVYTDGFPRQDTLGWTSAHPGVDTFDVFLSALEDGTLPRVSFVDPGPGQDEHPPQDVNEGEIWSRAIYETARASPLWPRLALVYTYDEGGGMFDHAPPPSACPPSPDLPELDVLGHRVPLIVVSPWARPGVYHTPSSHTSILRLIQLLHDLPALTARDASSSALLELFEFDCRPDLSDGPASVPAGALGCE